MVPQIRFKGFSEEWIEDQLGERVEFFSGLTYSPSNVQNGVGTLVLRSSNVKNGEVVEADNVYVDSKIVNSKNVEVGDIAVVVRNGSRSLIGKHAQIKVKMDNTVIGAFMTGIHSQRPAFTNALLDTVQFDNEIAKNLGATINQITTGSFKKMMFHFPEPAEQIQIGVYFKELDQMIGLHQRKHEKLVTLKKAMLKKMFPQNGATTPEIRFKGFSKPWEEKKLGECAKFSKGQGYSKGDLVASGAPIVLYGRLYTNYQTEISEVDTFVIENIGSVKSTGKEVIVPSSGETPEDIARASAIVKAGLLLGGDLNIIFPASNIDSCFLALTISNGTPRKDLEKRAQGKTVVHIRNSDLETVTVRYPSMEEQKKIGTYFRQLDELIEQHGTQLTKLKQIKTACLEKMFV